MRESRRHFLHTAVAGAAISCLPFTVSRGISAASAIKYRAAIIGHTGRGDYGHNLDLIFGHRKDVEVVAVADPVSEGRAQAAARSGALRQYADYHKMLATEKPDLVSIAPRWTDQHHAMALAALQSGAHVFMEKPITRTLAEADELLSVATASGRRIAIAHQMRLAPEILTLKVRIEEGLIGDLLEIQAHGKQDRRAGGEDLIVLGIHLFDLMRFFAGDPEWCTARVLERGQPINRNSGRPASEDIGLVAGDEVIAQFAFRSGMNATFTSRSQLRQVSGRWGMVLTGSKGVVRILADAQPRVYLRKDSEWSPAGWKSEWSPLDNEVTTDQTDLEQRKSDLLLPNQRLVDDWLDAVATGREPVCNGYSGMRAVEMAMAVFEAGVQRERVTFPLANRAHPFSKSS